MNNKNFVVKKLLAMTIAIVSILSCLTISSYAMDTDYQYATDVGTSFNITTDKISGADDANWYKFSITQPGAGYSFTLRDMPSGEPYNFELYYQETSGTYPSMLRMETKLTSTLRRTMHGVLENTGTYYLRVYSMTGNYTSENYRLTGSVGYGTYASMITKISSSNNLDWAACAEMAGKYKYYREISSAKLPSRTYNMAARYIQSNGSKDTGTPNNTKSTLEQTAKAANYIFSGTTMINPVFKTETNKVYGLTDCLKVIWGTDDTMIIRLADKEMDIERLSHYVVLDSVSPKDKYLDFHDPWTTSSASYCVDYDDFIINGYEGDGYATRYDGNNIICDY